ncbi:MAG: FtsX-like permease family protein [Gemmatimonadota bacterium]
MHGLGARNLLRRPQRTILAMLGIAVTSAMLLDMVLLAGGIERSFEQLLVGRGYQIRISPKGTLPFDTEAGIPAASELMASLRLEPGVELVAPLLGASLHLAADSVRITVTGYGIDPSAQAMYQLVSGADLEPHDSLGVLLGEPLALRLNAKPGDRLHLIGGLDPQLATAQTQRTLVVRGTVRWLYDYRGQPSVGTLVPVLQQLTGQARSDKVSALALKLTDGTDPDRLAVRLRARYPDLGINSVADLVKVFRERLVYFRQLSLILGSVSLVVTLLLVGTLLTITVNERLGEIATLRAIGVARGRIVTGVIAEGAALTMMGGLAGTGLGLFTARFLDRILTSFPGLPAAISFFVPRVQSLAVAAVVLLVAGCLAGAWPAWRAASAPIAATLRQEAT